MMSPKFKNKFSLPSLSYLDSSASLHKALKEIREDSEERDYLAEDD
jgi:hypothetical protein